MQDAVANIELQDSIYPCRAATAEEVEHYREFGWVKLKNFVHRDMVRKILDVALELMGDDGDSNAPFGAPSPFFNAAPGGGLSNPLMRALIREIGKSGKMLQNRQSGVGVRYFLDHFAVKLPSSMKSKRAGNGATNFHQDFMAHAADRTGGMTFWISLESYGPDSGTMAFISGSHRIGVMGNYDNYGGADVREVFPELRKLTQTQPTSYETGDVTVHNSLTVHGSGLNLTDRPRWAYMVLLLPADSYWTGAPLGCAAEKVIDNGNMVPNQLFDDSLFPILS